MSAAPNLIAAGTGVLITKNGTHLYVRRVWAGDAAALRRMHARMSADTLYKRYMVASPKEPSSAALRYLTAVDHRSREALVALHGGEIISEARYHMVGEATAEIAVVVEDAWQREGIARRLVSRLTTLARHEGITTFFGTMLAENAPALALMKSLFPEVHTRISQGELEFTIPLGSEPPAAAALVAGRSHQVSARLTQ